jgi:lipopolysaccharide export system protein LptA
MTAVMGIRQTIQWGIFILIVCLTVALPVGRADGEQPKLTAPGGAEIDFANDITKCFAKGSKLVEAYWKSYRIEAGYLEYNRNLATVRAQGKVRMIQKLPVYRVVTCNEFFFELKQEYIKAEKEVEVIFDEDTTLNGEFLDWDRRNDMIKVTGMPQINYKDMRINGERIEGQVNKGVFVFFGPVKGTGNDGSLKAGQIVFDRSLDKIFLKNNPVIVQGKNQFTAPEIIYDLKTRKATTKSDLNVN